MRLSTVDSHQPEAPLQCTQSPPLFDRNTTCFRSGILPTVDAHSTDRRPPARHLRQCSIIQRRTRACLFDATLSDTVGGCAVRRQCPRHWRGTLSGISQRTCKLFPDGDTPELLRGGLVALPTKNRSGIGSFGRVPVSGHGASTEAGSGVPQTTAVLPSKPMPSLSQCRRRQERQERLSNGG